MNIQISELIYKPCVIKPFENLQGVIVGLNQSKKGTELQVRYFLNGEYKLEWFFDFDIELKSIPQGTPTPKYALYDRPLQEMLQNHFYGEQNNSQ